MGATKRETLAKAKEAGLISPHEACKLIGCSRRKLGRLVITGDIKQHFIDEVAFYDPDDIETYKGNDPDDDEEDGGKQYVLDYCMGRMKDLEGLVDKFVGRYLDNMDGMFKENEALRSHIRSQDATISEVQEARGELISQISELQLNVEKEQRSMQMRSDAFNFAKDQLFPAMIQNMASKRFMETFTDEQIGAAIESGFFDKDQTETLKKVIKKRSKQRKGTTDGTESKPAEPAAEQAKETVSEGTAEGSGASSAGG